MPTLKGTEVSLSYVQCFLCLVSSSVNVSNYQIMWLDTFWTDHIFVSISNVMIHSFMSRVVPAFLQGICSKMYPVEA